MTHKASHLMLIFGGEQLIPLVVLVAAALLAEPSHADPHDASITGPNAATAAPTQNGRHPGHDALPQLNEVTKHHVDGFCRARDLPPDACDVLRIHAITPIFDTNIDWSERACAVKQPRTLCALTMHDLNAALFEELRGVWRVFMKDRESRFAALSPRNFRGADLRGVDFGGQVLVGADFTDAQLDGADFFEAVLDGARFDGAILRNASFLSAALDRASFVGATLDEAIFIQASGFDVDFSRASMRGAQLQSSVFVDAIMRSADLTMAYLSGARLVGADLDRARLAGTIFWGTDLSGASFAEVSGAQVFMWSADLRSTNWSGSRLDSGVVSDADFSTAMGLTQWQVSRMIGPVRRSIDLQGADTGQQLQFAECIDTAKGDLVPDHVWTISPPPVPEPWSSEYEC
jgi:uncharacterized protein YjbI with pentapeptide repeats